MSILIYKINVVKWTQNVLLIIQDYNMNLKQIQLIRSK